MIGNENPIPITRYRRIRRLKANELLHMKDKRVKKEDNGEDVIIFTKNDFGVISTDDELRTFLNKELAKDKIRVPILEQK